MCAAASTRAEFDLAAARAADLNACDAPRNQDDERVDAVGDRADRGSSDPLQPPQLG